MIPFLSFLSVAAFAAAILPTKLAHAQSRVSTHKKDQEIELLKTEVRQLEQRVNTLERLDERVKVIDSKLKTQEVTQKVQLKAHEATQKVQREIQLAQSDLERKKSLETPTVTADSKRGFGIWLPGPPPEPGDPYENSILFKGTIQGDGRFFTSGDNKNISSTFYMNKVRPILAGRLWDYYTFSIVPDFGQGKAVLEDGWISGGYDRYVFQLGKFKAPVNMERLQSDPQIEFVQRSELQNLVPNRDIGAEIFGDFFCQRLSYQIAFMNGVPNNTASVDFDNNDSKDFMGRIFLTPFQCNDHKTKSECNEPAWLQQLGIGFGGTYGDERGSTTSVYKTWGQSTWFSYNKGVTASGLRTHLDPQIYYYFDRFGLMAEYAQDEHSLNLFNSFGAAPHKRLINRTDTFTDTGYMAQASFLLTHDKASFDGVKPSQPFGRGGWGAWELAARISNNAAQTRQFQLGFANPSVSAKTATEFALGINWYLNDNVRWWFDYANTYFDGGAGTAAAPRDRPNESVFESQVQIAF